MTFGGINLGVSTYSKNKELAFEAAKCLRERREPGGRGARRAACSRRARRCSRTRRSAKAYPFADIVEQTLQNGVPRPVLPAYADISLAIQDKLHPPGDIEPEQAIEDLRDALEKAEGREALLMGSGPSPRAPADEPQAASRRSR